MDFDLGHPVGVRKASFAYATFHLGHAVNLFSPKSIGVANCKKSQKLKYLLKDGTYASLTVEK